jgi:hypothetical protein
VRLGDAPVDGHLVVLRDGDELFTYHEVASAVPPEPSQLQVDGLAISPPSWLQASVGRLRRPRDGDDGAVS